MRPVFTARKSLNYYLVCLYRLLLVMFLFFLCRVLFYLLNKNLFPDIGAGEWMNILKGGWVFDQSAMLYFNIPFILLSLLPLPFFIRASGTYQAVLKWLYFITNGLAILLNCIDFIYYRFTLRRTTSTVFSEFSNEQNKKSLAFHFLADYWYVALIFILLIVLMIWAYNRIVIKKEVPRRQILYYLTALVILCGAALLTVGGIRGDFRHSTRPITISNAGQYVKNPQNLYLVLNTPFCFVRTWGNKKIEALHYFRDSELDKIYTPVHYPSATDTAHFRKKNVVIIILESFGKEAIGGYNKDLDNGTYTGYTPFLDSLMARSKVYWNSFATGHKSIDAIPSILTGIPNGQNPFVLTPYATDSLLSLPKILSNEGYYTSFFHGAPNGSMGFLAFTKMIGIQDYFGKTEYNNDNDYDGIWGIWDGPFFRFFEQKLNTFKQPFFSAIFSVSSHHPFQVPEPYKDKVKKGPLPIFHCINYTDMALKAFFDKASKTDWYKNTLFVISADHATERYHKEYLNAWGDAAIPILLFSPGDSTFSGVDSGIIQQTDIMPTVLAYLHYNKPFLAFGENVFAKPRMNFAYNYAGDYRWFQDDYLLLFDGEKSSALYNYKEDRLLQHNLLQSQPQQAAVMERNLKAYIQQYNNRLISNRLYPVPLP